VLHRLGVVRALPGWRQVPQRLGVAGPVGQLDQDGLVRGPAEPAQVVLLDAGPVLAGSGLGDRHPADQFGDPRAEPAGELVERARGVLDHVVQHRGAQDVGAGHAGAADEHLQGLQQVIGVGRPGWPLLIPMAGGGEVNRLMQLGHGVGGQLVTQSRFGLLPVVPGGEELHVTRC
jgi:hypothetical protein